MALRDDNCGEVGRIYMGELLEDKGYFSKARCRLVSVLTHCLQWHELSSLPGTGKGDTVTKENVGPAFRWIRGRPENSPWICWFSVAFRSKWSLSQSGIFWDGMSLSPPMAPQCRVSFGFARHILSLPESDFQMTQFNDLAQFCNLSSLPSPAHSRICHWSSVLLLTFTVGPLGFFSLISPIVPEQENERNWSKERPKGSSALAARTRTCTCCTTDPRVPDLT